jgi:hypothetical protein
MAAVCKKCQKRPDVEAKETQVEAKETQDEH